MGKKEKRYAKDHAWVGSQYNGSTDADDQLLKDNIDQVEILAEVDDNTLSWEFDELVVAYLKGHGYFICQATGCSCPSPSETWSVVHRFKTKKAVMKAIEDGAYQGYTLPSYAITELREQLLGS